VIERSTGSTVVGIFCDFEKRFTAADPDKDGTLDRKELRSAAGRALVHLVR
jgi:hypothetical protein